MIKREMSADSVSPDRERMSMYKAFAMTFSYPDDSFFTFCLETSEMKNDLYYEYDRLFRNNEIWLYGTHYTAKNEFQVANALSDISGFYRAFGLETNGDRPDSLTTELEFMHYLIFKQINAPDREKSSVCYSAQKKFFNEHLYPAAKKIAELIISKADGSFYKRLSKEALSFLEEERKFLRDKI